MKALPLVASYSRTGATPRDAVRRFVGADPTRSAALVSGQMSPAQGSIGDPRYGMEYSI